MKMIVVPQIGGPEVLTLVDCPTPVPGPDEVLVKLIYAGLSYADIYQRAGTYRSAPLKEGEAPLKIGGDGAGQIVAVGTNVRDLKEGDEVVYLEQLGSYAEYVAVPAARAFKIPSGVPLKNAVAAFSLGTTAHYLAHDVGKLQPGQSCLVHAGAGGVGHLLVQFARHLGANVMATVSSADKAAFVLEIGADRAVNYKDADFLTAVREWTDGKGVDVAFDSVGQVTIEKSIQAVKVRGLCVLYGISSGPVSAVSPNDLAAAGSIYFARPRLGHFIRTRAELAKRADDIFSLLRDGKLRVMIAGEFPLEQAVAAHRLLQSRGSIGKILLSF